MQYGLPEKHGLYDPANEKDACGVGFVAQIKGVASHQIVKDANRILCNMDHRGARGSETNTGDGAGMLTALPDKLLRRAAKAELGIELPASGKYGVGNIFLPTDEAERAYCKAAFVKAIEAQGQRLLGWRVVPTDPDGANLGPTAIESMPQIEQLFIGAAEGLDQDAFERQLYVIRKSAASPLRVDESLKQRSMLYGDLTDPDYETHLAMVHSRFATNTFPTWERAQPLRCLSHNGEINTLRGNKNAMHSRQGVVESELFGDDLRKLFPVAELGLSDSGTLDNVLEFLYMNGRSMPEAAMMMIPEAWQKHKHMPQVKRDFYEYHSCLMEPWDGPASIAFTDGTMIGAVLDRNGLRPSRYYLTHDDRVIMASEVGVLPVPPETVKHKGRLQPGRMFLIDFEQGRMIPDEELKNDFATRRPYGEWLRDQRLKLTKLPVHGDAHGFEPETLLARMQSFGYTTETMQFMLRRDAPRPHAVVWLHHRDDAIHAAADDRAEARSGRVHGQRLGSRGLERSAAACVRLLQAALCAGDQSPDRLDSRGSDHGDGVLHRAGAKPPHHDARARPPASDSAPDFDQ